MFYIINNAIGRWTVMDPVSFVDPDGMEIDTGAKESWQICRKKLELEAAAYEVQASMLTEEDAAKNNRRYQPEYSN